MANRRKVPSRGTWLRRFTDQGARDRAELGASLAPHEIAALGSYYWQGWARDAQLPPDKAWRTWLICAGRGFGKTRAGAEWVRDVARHDGNARIALVGASLAEVRQVMVEGDSGVLAASPGALVPHYEPSLRRLTWENGAIAWLYSAAEPDSLRGPQHSHAWCDEIAKWDNVNDRATAAWDNLQLTMRLGDGPRVLATTTPRMSELMHRLLADAKRGKVVLARGRTVEAKQILPADYFRAMIEQYEESHFGRQELDGELADGAEGALWTRDLLERCRTDGPVPDARRVVVAVDPPASWAENQWLFLPPREGFRVFDLASGSLAAFSATVGWQRVAAPAAAAGGATVDSEARAAIVALLAALRAAGIFSA